MLSQENSIIPEAMKKEEQEAPYLKGLGDPVEMVQDEVYSFEYMRELNPKAMKKLPRSEKFKRFKRGDYNGEKTTPIYKGYKCKIPISCFKRPKFNEVWMDYEVNVVQSKWPSLLKDLWTFENEGHQTDKSVLIRSQREFEIQGVTGDYEFINTLSQQDVIDFLSVNFVHLKKQISHENRDFSEERVHKLACMYTAVRYVALVQGYLANSQPSHWEIVEEVKERISEEVMKEINSMKSDVHQLIVATTAEWWVSDFSVGPSKRFPPLLKKMLFDLKTLNPIFRDLMPSYIEMQELLHKAIHLVDRRNVLKAINMDDPDWTGEVPIGLPTVKKIHIERIASSEISEMLRRVPAGYSSYGMSHKILQIMKKYKLSEFIFYQEEAKLVELVFQEISEKPNYHHINSPYLNQNDSRFKEPERHQRDRIQNIVRECGMFLMFTKCHLGLLKSPIFRKKLPATIENIMRICPNWLKLLHDYINDQARIEKVKELLDAEDCDKEKKNLPFYMSVTSVLMEQFASTFRVREGYIYRKDENGILLFVDSVKKKENLKLVAMVESFKKILEKYDIKC